MKHDLYRPDGVELRIRTGRLGSLSRRSAKPKLIAGAIAVGGLAYLLTQLGIFAAALIMGAFLLIFAGLVGVAAWGQNNSPW